MKRILLDTNIVLDFVLEREPFIEEAEAILKFSFEKRMEAFISATTITDIYYLSRKEKNKDEAKNFLKHILSFIEVAGVNKEVIFSALNSNLKDFEDAVQVHSATYNNLDLIITRNEKDFKHSEIPVINPKDFILSF